MLFQEFAEDQSKHFIGSIQLFEGYEEKGGKSTLICIASL